MWGDQRWQKINSLGGQVISPPARAYCRPLVCVHTTVYRSEDGHLAGTIPVPAGLPFMDMTSDLTMKSASGITCLETQFCDGRATTLTCFSLTMVTNCRSHDTCDCCWSCATPEPPTPPPPPGLLDTLSELPVSAGDMRFSPLEFLVGVSATRPDRYCNCV